MMSTNLVQQVSQVTDLEKLREITRGIIGEVCWKATFSYGDELSLHIGEKIPYSQKSMAGKEKGAWILGTRATKWRLEKEGETIAISSEEADILKQKVHVIENNIITAFETSYPDLGLTVIFSDKYKLMLFPEICDSCDLPYWELFTPERMVLKVGLGAVWSYVSAV